MRGLAVLGLVLLGGCNLLGAPSRVKAGELFETGEARYDTYFKEVHEVQVRAASWPDDRKATRRPLVDALKLTPEAADVTIVQTTHERVSSVSRDVGPTKLEVNGEEAHVTALGASKVDDPTRELFKAIEATTRGELARAKSLRQIPTRIDELTKIGRELAPHVREDFAKHGGRVPRDVQEELTASYDVIGNVSRDARSGAREAEDFIADLRRAVGSDAPEAKEEKASPPPKKAEKAEAKPLKKETPLPVKPGPKPEPKSEATPAPKPADEVFSP